MCGFVAAFTSAPLPREAARRALDRMLRRGPDGEAEWREGGVYLGHRRRAILDLDTRAGQPMLSACGRYAVVFNGEIYNFRSLRRELEARGYAFRTTSDTEVILLLFAADGAAMLPKLQGMFAFVIWDRLACKAFAARDPYGIKPLYVATTSNGVMFASQVKALVATGLVSRAPDPRGQAGFWMLGSVPEPRTWYRDIRAVPSGHCVWIEDGEISSQFCWHDIGEAWRTAEASSERSNAVANRVRDALRESVRRHLVADLPVGVFLSGGIDSGALAGLMVEAGASELQGVTIGYDEYSGRPEDEAPVAARVARQYGIRHHVRCVTRAEFLADLPRILDAMDQPSIDGVNTWFAAKAVAEFGLKVVVSGVGGDELFFGYQSFRQLPWMVAWWCRWSRIPGLRPLARLAAEAQAWRTGNGRWRYAPEWAGSISGAWWLRRSVCSPAELSDRMGADLAAEALREFDAEAWVASMTGPLPENLILAVGQIESMTYLRNQLLRDSDWASMDHSVELRTPLVDAHLLRQIKPLLPAFDGLPKKSLLATAPAKPLPREVLERRKTGFGIPVTRWLAGALGANGRYPVSAWARTVASECPQVRI